MVQVRLLYIMHMVPGKNKIRTFEKIDWFFTTLILFYISIFINVNFFATWNCVYNAAKTKTQKKLL